MVDHQQGIGRERVKTLLEFVERKTFRKQNRNAGFGTLVNQAPVTSPKMTYQPTAIVYGQILLPIPWVSLGGTFEWKCYADGILFAEVELDGSTDQGFVGSNRHIEKKSALWTQVRPTGVDIRSIQDALQRKANLFTSRSNHDQGDDRASVVSTGTPAHRTQHTVG